MSYLDLAFKQRLIWAQPALAGAAGAAHVFLSVNLLVLVALYFGSLFALESWFRATRDYPMYVPTPVFGMRLLQALHFRLCFHMSSYYDFAVAFARKR